jgi:glycosyl transferase family 25
VLILIVFIYKNRTLFFTQTKELFTDNDLDVYLINMEKNKDRLDHFTKIYAESDLRNIPYTIFPAIVGKDLELEKYVTPKTYKQIMTSELLRKRNTHYELSIGAVGCYLSHLHIYKKIIESDKKYGLIFEDDVSFDPNFLSKLSTGLTMIPDDWDLLMCGIFCLDCETFPNYLKVGKFWGAHAYVIKKESARKLYNELNKLISRQIDGDIEFLIKTNKINVYAIHPEIATQDGRFGTDIQLAVTPDDNIDPFVDTNE